MKGLYLSNIDPLQSFGYMSKILGQIKGFSELGIDMELLRFNHQAQIVLTAYPSAQSNRNPQTTILGSAGTNLFVRRFNLLNQGLKHIKTAQPDFLYFRYPRSEPLYLYFLSRIRNRFPKLLILSEFPTFPYDAEYEKAVQLKDKIVLQLDKFTRQHLKHFVHRAVAVNYAQPIFGIPTISIDNGIHVADYAIASRQNLDASTIHLIGVANVNPWHGYDRVLTGLSQYFHDLANPTPKVTFHIVGAQGPYLAELQQLADQLRISDHIIFHPPVQGQKLDSFFDNADLAIGVLGGHRKGLSVMSPLKNREYCARGIPFVLSHKDPDFPMSFQYCLHLPSSEKPVDINQLVMFLEEIGDRKAIAFRMREYANSQISWARKLQPVKGYVKLELNG